MSAHPIALTGATGFVGQALLAEAAARGCAVKALARRPQPPRAGVEWVAGDLADKAALARLVAGAGAVVHVAGVVNAADAAGFEAGNVAGTAALIEAARAAGCQRFVFVSSLAARAPALSAYGASKARAEGLVAASGLDWTIVRPPSVYGPRDTENFELFKSARLGVVPVPRGVCASQIYVEDLARLLLDLVPATASLGATYEPDDGRPGGWPMALFARAIGQAVGRRVWVPQLSPGLLRLAARIDVALRGGRAKLTPDRASYMSHTDWVARAAAHVPPAIWRPRVGGAEGLAATVAWYRAQGWL
ncbi:MAG TPA: NAD(P)H-binding protein [Novosphingobium sp.]|nr:NAD(P)H-binding protein [Novosphingobium sp.]